MRVWIIPLENAHKLHFDGVAGAVTNSTLRTGGNDQIVVHLGSALLDSTLNTYVIYLLPRMLTYTLFIGILRAGGDTRFCMLLDVGGIWCIGVPLAFLSAIVFQWQLPYVVALSLADEFFKLFICLWRLRSRRWINVLI